MTHRLFSILLLGVTLILVPPLPSHADGRIVKVGIYDFKPLCTTTAFQIMTTPMKSEGLYLALS